MNASRSLLVVANGHGEDVVAARVIAAVKRLAPDQLVTAFPVVGFGNAMQEAGALIVGPRRELPSGGLTLHSGANLKADIRAGLIGLSARQYAWSARARPRAVLAVGDLYAEAIAALTRAPRRVIQSLVSVHQAHRSTRPLGRYFMESFRAPELVLLRRSDAVYARDAATAAYLRSRGVANATYLGNPMMDDLEGAPLTARESGRNGGGGPRLALLPGTRPYALRSVGVMVAALERIPGSLGMVAWTLGAPPAPPPGWESDFVDVAGVVAAWRYGSTRVWWVSGRFADVLATADLALGTAGTANEQAVGVGLPLIAYPFPPDYSAAFVENQERLLAGAVTVVGADAGEVAAAAMRAWRDPQARQRVLRVAAERMGAPGASSAIAADLVEWLARLTSQEAAGASASSETMGAEEPRPSSSNSASRDRHR